MFSAVCTKLWVGRSQTCISQHSSEQLDIASLPSRSGWRSRRARWSGANQSTIGQDIKWKYIYSPTRYTRRFHRVSFYWALRLQLYMFRTSRVHPQELLCRYCICRVLPTTLYQLDVSGSTRITTCHSLHIQYLHKSSWGWTHDVRNM